jgi:hypothetical protein
MSEINPLQGTFSGLSNVTNLKDGIRARLNRVLAYKTKDGWMIKVPRGFITNYASIPRVIWSVIPPHGKYNRPAIIHDFLYKYAPIDPKTGKKCTQSRADYIIREGCEAVGVRWWKKWSIWSGLRIGGWVVWRKYRKEEI